MKFIPTLKLTLTGLLLALGFPLLAQTSDAQLHVSVKGAKQHFGKVLLMLIKEGETAMIKFDSKDPGTEVLDFAFEQLPTSPLTVYVFQDENNSFALDHNAEGLPIEPCAVQTLTLATGENTLEINLILPKESQSAIYDGIVKKDQTPPSNVNKNDKPAKEKRARRERNR